MIISQATTVPQRRRRRGLALRFAGGSGRGVAGCSTGASPPRKASSGSSPISRPNASYFATARSERTAQVRSTPEGGDAPVLADLLELERARHALLGLVG